jgi:Putative peptidoglycan binding domain
MAFIDPGVINIAILGIGLGMVSKKQSEGVLSGLFKSKGDFLTAGEDLRDFVRTHLAPRYGAHAVGQDVAAKQYGPLSSAAVQALLGRATAAGMTISGNNPWTVDAHRHGVSFQVAWDPATGLVTATVTSKNIYVPYGSIWEQVDGLVPAAMAAHSTQGAYDVPEDVHQDERVEAAQRMLNELYGRRPGAPLCLDETGVLDGLTRQAVRSFQLESGVGPCDGTPTEETLIALAGECDNKRQVLAGAWLVGQAPPPPPPEPDWSALARGCPKGTWYDPLENVCKPKAPLPPPQPSHGMPLPAVPYAPIPTASPQGS